mmetsp:Transcript_2158/g.3060  ORF Transcript_2158/g.3060 Transcript_2158/m.3060 type:complete len:470 (-) Transcript_2158:135-1544(-)
MADKGSPWKYDAFLAHEGGGGNVTPDAVWEVSKELGRRLRVWVDKGRGYEDCKARIQECKTAIIFVTRRYMERIQSKEDDCARKLVEIMKHIQPHHTIVIVLDKNMLDKDEWYGSLFNVLMQSPSIDMTSEYLRRTNFDYLCERIEDASTLPVVDDEDDDYALRNSVIKEIDKGQCNATTLIEYMDQFRFDEQVQWRTCQAFEDFLRGNDNVTIGEAMQLGAGDRILRAMDDHHNVEKVQDYACRAIINLSSGHERNKDALMEIGCAEKILRAIDNHPNSDSVAHYALWALATLAFSGAYKQTLMQFDIAKRIREAMSRHRYSSGVQLYGCWTIYNLSVSSENQVLLMKEDLGELVLEAMDNIPDDASVQEFGCKALYNLAVNDENETSLLRMGAGNRVVAAMQNHPDEELVQQEGCWALLHFSYKSPNKATLLNLNAISWIRKAMDKFEFNTIISDKGYRAIQNIQSF